MGGASLLLLLNSPSAPPAPAATVDVVLWWLLQGGGGAAPAVPKVPILLLTQGIAIMPAKGAALTISYTAWDTAAGRPKLGDTGQHTLYWTKDGTSAATTNAPAGITSPADAGESKVLLTASECTCNFGKLWGVSSTAGVILIPVPVAFESGKLAADGLDAIALETGINARQGLTMVLAGASGVVTVDQFGATVVKGANSNATRMTATVTAYNRASVVLSLPS